jgi:SAM-dependent methyltransferase
MSATVLEFARCPRCGAPLDLHAAAIKCAGCSQLYPRLGAIPILLPEPRTYIAIALEQLERLKRQVVQTADAIEEQLQSFDIVPLTAARCRGLAAEAAGQVEDVAAILGPHLPTLVDDSMPRSLTGELPSLLTNIHYAFRDWGAAETSDAENERSLALIEGVMSDRAPGRTLVLGAGACRLAYDLHRRAPGSETVVVDIDSLLFAIAHAVIRGATVSLRESYADIGELEHIARRWSLAATEGPLDDRFHFLLADGLDPPFASGTFDIVVTPWFIDAIPADMRDFFSTVFRLLKPGGQWVNVGPLRYTEKVPLVRRFTREEIFDLIARAGFRLGSWHTASIPYLVSMLHQQGKVVWLLAFGATKATDSVPVAATDRARDWILFRHLPVPTFAGQSLVVAGDPVEQMVVSAIDGQRTLEDLATLVAGHLKRPDIPRERIRRVVKEFLLQVHPLAMSSRAS